MCRAIGRADQPGGGVLNLIVMPDMVEPLMKVRGVFSAYRMDRRHGVSVIQDGGRMMTSS